MQFITNTKDINSAVILLEHLFLSCNLIKTRASLSQWLVQLIGLHFCIEEYNILHSVIAGAKDHIMF